MSTTSSPKNKVGPVPSTVIKSDKSPSATDTKDDMASPSEGDLGGHVVPHSSEGDDEKDEALMMTGRSVESSEEDLASWSSGGATGKGKGKDENIAGHVSSNPSSEPTEEPEDDPFGGDLHPVVSSDALHVPNPVHSPPTAISHRRPSVETATVDKPMDSYPQQHTGKNPATGETEVVDAALAHLIGMGFEIEVATGAVQHVLGDGMSDDAGEEDTENRIVDAAVAWIVASGGSGENITYSPTPPRSFSPAPHEPLSTRHTRPDKGILKQTQPASPPTKPITAFFKGVFDAANRDASVWRDKVEKAIKSVSGDLPLAGSSIGSNITAGQNQPPAQLQTQPTFIIATPSTSSDSLNRLADGDGLRPKHVRFSFPDVRITESEEARGTRAPVSTILEKERGEEVKVVKTSVMEDGVDDRDWSLWDVGTDELAIKFVNEAFGNEDAGTPERKAALLNLFSPAATRHYKTLNLTTYPRPHTDSRLLCLIHKSPLKSVTVDGTTGPETVKQVLAAGIGGVVEDWTVRGGSGWGKYIGTFAKKNPMLKSLDLENTRLDNHAVGLIAHALNPMSKSSSASESDQSPAARDASKLRSLKLVQVEMEKGGWYALAPAIASSKIHTLHLTNMSPHASYLSHFLCALTPTPPAPPSPYIVPPPQGLTTLHLEALSLMGCGPALGLAITAAQELTSLALVKVTIGSEDLGAVLDSLKGHGKIRSLNLGYTRVDIPGSDMMDHLTPILTSTSLQTVLLPSTNLSPPSLIALAETLPLAHLVTLDVRDNPVGVGGVMALAGCLKMCGSMRECGVVPVHGGESFSEDDQTTLALLLNDVDMYIHRNTQIPLPSSSSNDLLPDDNPQNDTWRLDAPTLETDLSAAEETASLLREMATDQSNDDLIQHLSSSCRTFAQRFHTLILQSGDHGLVMPEILLDKVLKIMDQIESVLVKVENMQQSQSQSQSQQEQEGQSPNLTNSHPSQLPQKDSLSNISDIDIYGPGSPPPQNASNPSFTLPTSTSQPSSLGDIQTKDLDREMREMDEFLNSS
ncbi:hypothetical protein DFS34DRAFT_226731 [Phlyctochytrium arcticum]|nr:hypothetical protein DFS34DRAFT_226731 [Phlyctochytrium arcticum]